jgi:hypothetical protein
MKPAFRAYHQVTAHNMRATAVLHMNHNYYTLFTYGAGSEPSPLVNTDDFKAANCNYTQVTSLIANFLKFSYPV